jgi:hypothetical protein
VVATTMDGLAWVRKQVEQADTDLLREMVKLFCERLMGEEADAICGAPYGERSEDRTNRRNGYRSRPGTLGPARSIWPSRSSARAATSQTGCWSRAGVPSARSSRWSASPTCAASRHVGSRAWCEPLGSSGSPRAGSRRWPRSSTQPSRPSAPVRSIKLPTRTFGSMRSCATRRHETGRR